MTRRPLRADAGPVLAVLLAFAAVAVLSRESFGSSAEPSFFYPAAGIGVGAMLITRRGLWPWIALAVVTAEIWVEVYFQTPMVVSAGFAAANAIEPLVGASLVSFWCAGRPDLRKRWDFAYFIAGACLIAPLVGGLIGGTTISIHYGTSWLDALVTWWAGDALGILVIAAPILLWAKQSEVLGRRPWDAVGVLVLTVVLSVTTFWTQSPPSMLILPVLAWAAFRLDMLGAALAGAVAAYLANVMTSHGRGLFSSAEVSPVARAVLTQGYLAVIVVVAMLIAQEAAARLNAVREREIERRERIRLETLSRLAHQLSAALTPAEIGQALESHVLNEAGASALSLGLVSADGRKLEWLIATGFLPSMIDTSDGGLDLSERAMSTDVVKSGTPIAVHTAAEYAAAYPQRAHVLRLGSVESMVSWPLTSGGEPFGALQMVWPDRQPLDEAQRAYVSAVATLVSQALVRARMHADEHARAAVLHSVAQPVAQLDTVGLEYSALYRPADAAHGLGGDWYTVMALPGRRTYLAVGDVIGHGLLAVEDMVQLRSTGNAYAHQGLSAAQLLTELNGFAVHQIGGEFATNFVAIFDPDQGSLSYGSAGHLPALLRRAETGEVVRLADAQGPMLGPFDDAVYVERTVRVGPGDVLAMYTDGLVEHYDEDLMAGISHLEQVILAWPPDALLDCEALARDVAPAPFTDDLCLLIVRFTGPKERNDR